MVMQTEKIKQQEISLGKWINLKMVIVVQTYRLIGQSSTQLLL